MRRLEEARRWRLPQIQLVVSDELHEEGGGGTAQRSSRPPVRPSAALEEDEEAVASMMTRGASEKWDCCWKDVWQAGSGKIQGREQ